MIAVWFRGVRSIGVGTKRFTGAGSFLKLIQTCVTEGVKTGLTFLTQGIAAPVQIRHDCLYIEMSCNQKTISGFGNQGNNLKKPFSSISRTRRAVLPTLGKDVLTFSVPFALCREMEKNVPGSFLELDLWKELRDAT